MSLNTVYQEKITSIQPTYKDKGYFGVAEKSLKNSSTTKPNPLLLKITQMTESFRNSTGKLSGITLFQN